MLWRTTPAASVTSTSGTLSIAVPLRGRPLGRVLDLGDGDVVARQHRRLGRHVGARLACRRREHDDEPRRVGTGEVGAVDLHRHVGGRLRGRIGAAAAEEQGDDRRRPRRSPRRRRRAPRQPTTGKAHDALRPWAPGSRGSDRSTNTRDVDRTTSWASIGAVGQGDRDQLAGLAARRSPGPARRRRRRRRPPAP